MRTRLFRKNQQGQAMVEFAIVLPVLLLLVLGLMQFGLAYFHHLTVTDAVRAGARQAAVSRELPDPAGTAEARVRAAATDLVQADLEVYVTSSWVQGEDVEVRATYPYDINLLGMVLYSGDLKSSTTERVE
jgi:Flp pilus assembly protein TadG